MCMCVLARGQATTEVTGLAAKPVILPSDQSETTAFKLFYALKSMEAKLWDWMSHFTSSVHYRNSVRAGIRR